MEKYKTQFKLKVVKSFSADDGEAKLLARQSIVPEEKSVPGFVITACMASPALSTYFDASHMIGGFSPLL